MNKLEGAKNKCIKFLKSDAFKDVVGYVGLGISAFFMTYTASDISWRAGRKSGIIEAGSASQSTVDEYIAENPETKEIFMDAWNKKFGKLK